MDEFLKTWYGLALFIAFDVAAALVVMAIAYRWIFKRFWDAVAALVCMTILSPLYLAVLVRGKIYKKRTGNMRSLVTHEFYVGKKSQNDRAQVVPNDGRRRKRGRKLRPLAQTHAVL